MPTSSIIGLEEPDGTIMSIFCRDDGDLPKTGAMLLAHYLEESKIRELLDLGDIVFLGKNLAPPKYHPNYFADSVRAYARDNNTNPGVVAAEFTNHRSLILIHEYAYLWVVVEQRWVFNDELDPGWYPLAEWEQT